MRTGIIVCSILSAILVAILGGLASIFFGFGFDYATPYNDPHVAVPVMIFSAPGVILALVGSGIALNDASRRRLTGWFSGLLAWPLVPVAAAGLMFAQALAHPELWWLALAFLPLAPFLYALMAPSEAATPGANRPQSTISPRYLTFLGILVVVTLAGILLQFPSPQTRNTGPGAPITIHVTQSTYTADCASGIYPTITLTNSGNKTLQWTATSQDPNITARPSQGSLNPGATATVSLSGKTSASDVIVLFHAGGQGAPAKIGCQ